MKIALLKPQISCDSKKKWKKIINHKYTELKNKNLEKETGFCFTSLLDSLLFHLNMALSDSYRRPPPFFSLLIEMSQSQRLEDLPNVFKTAK